MILGNRNDLFKIEFPKIFIPDVVKEKYKDYIFRLPLGIRDVTELVNYTIQSITIPSFSYDPAEQTQSGYGERKRGSIKKYRSSSSYELLMDRSFTITFKLLDGNINYWILLDTLFYYYNFDNSENKYTPDINIKIYNTEGFHLYTIRFKDCLFTEIGEFVLSYSELSPDFKTFDTKFSYNLMDFDLAK